MVVHLNGKTRLADLGGVVNEAVTRSVDRRRYNPRRNCYQRHRSSPLQHQCLVPYKHQQLVFYHQARLTLWMWVSEGILIRRRHRVNITTIIITWVWVSWDIIWHHRPTCPIIHKPLIRSGATGVNRAIEYVIITINSDDKLVLVTATVYRPLDHRV